MSRGLCRIAGMDVCVPVGSLFAVTNAFVKPVNEVHDTFSALSWRHALE